MIAGRRILIVKLADIGDAVLTLPAIQAIRRQYPNAGIDVLTTEAGSNVFKLSPAIDDVITLAKHRFDRVRGLLTPRGAVDIGRLGIDLRRRGYSAVVLFHHFTTRFGAMKFQALVRATGAGVSAGIDNGRGGFLTHRTQDFGFGARSELDYGLELARVLGADATEEPPELEIPTKAAETADQLLRREGLTGYFAVVHAEVGDYSPARAWPPRRFAILAESLTTSRKMPIVLVGTDRASDMTRTIASVDGVHNFVGRTSFPELCEIVRRAALVIGCDSAVSHLAGAFQRPLLTLFGPSNIEAWRPYGSEPAVIDSHAEPTSTAVALTRALPCSPCLYTGFRLGRRFGCSHRTCLLSIEPDAVERMASTVLKNSQNLREN